MQRFAVFKGYNTKDARFRLAWQEDLAPMADAAIVLNFAPQWRSDDLTAHFDGQVDALAHDLLFEIARHAQYSLPTTNLKTAA